MEELHLDELNERLASKKSFVLFVYTPMCGTCKITGQMLRVVEAALPDVSMYQINLNTSPSLSEKWQISSVPALLLIRSGRVQERYYALHSVAHLYELLKSFS
ncbi:MAG TPA: thioredoxin family protein [Brevibacillus sp.]|nr:thioredoxin family protein [Brevibacillus sp.]